jgi:hypothetical protein
MFSFALAVVLTPIVVAREALRVVHAEQANGKAISPSVTFSEPTRGGFRVSRRINCTEMAESMA